MKRVYVAGSYSSTDVIQVFNNMREGIRWSTQALLRGYAPFCPWADYHFQLQLREGETLTVEDYYKYSLAWLDASDALVVLPNSESSIGTTREIKRARDLGIPVFRSLDELDAHFLPSLTSLKS